MSHHHQVLCEFTQKNEQLSLLGALKRKPQAQNDVTWACASPGQDFPFNLIAVCFNLPQKYQS